MKFFDWELDIEGSLKTYVDIENRRVAILTKLDDEIHMTLELDKKDQLVMHPRWSINITVVGDKHLKLTTNTED